MSLCRARWDENKLGPFEADNGAWFPQRVQERVAVVGPFCCRARPGSYRRSAGSFRGVGSFHPMHGMK